MEERYKLVDSILDSECPENAIPILEEFIAMCPHSREAYIRLLYCYYIQNDWVMMKRLLNQRINLDSVVSERSVWGSK